MKKLLLSAFVLVSIVACNDKKEKGESKNEPPTITIISQSTPTVSEHLCDALFDNVLKVATSDTLRFVFSFRAQNPLSQYKIDVHSNFDCHVHGKSLPWSLLKLVDLSGTEATITEELIVPDDAAAGNYHLMIRLLDTYGMEAEVKEFNLIIFNSEDQVEPAIHITAPLVNSSYHHGDKVFFKGTITDNYALTDSRFELKFTDVNNHTYNLYEIFYPSQTTTSYTIDTAYTIGTFIPLGAGYFTIKAYDKANNYGVKTVDVTIE